MAAEQLERDLDHGTFFASDQLETSNAKLGDRQGEDSNLDYASDNRRKHLTSAKKSRYNFQTDEKANREFSVEKSQNFEINLDEYSPITVAYSSRIKQGNWDREASAIPISN